MPPKSRWVWGLGFSRKDRAGKWILEWTYPESEGWAEVGSVCAEVRQAPGRGGLQASGGLQQEGWWSDIRQDSPRATEGKVFGWFWKLSLALLPGPHILGESWSRPDPNPCSQIEIFLVPLWGVTSMPSPPGWPGWGAWGSEAPAQARSHSPPTRAAEPQSWLGPQLLGRETEAQAE